MGIAVEREKEELEEGDGVKERRDVCVGEGRTTARKQCEGRGLTVRCPELIIHSPCFTGTGYKLQNRKVFSMTAGASPSGDIRFKRFTRI